MKFKNTHPLGCIDADACVHFTAVRLGARYDCFGSDYAARSKLAVFLALRGYCTAECTGSSSLGIATVLVSRIHVIRYADLIAVLVTYVLTHAVLLNKETSKIARVHSPASKQP